MEDDSLYNAIIAALVLGIVIVIATLIFMRPSPEYFTELYYTNHTLLPKYIEPGKEYSFSITIANHENGTIIYPVIVKADLDNRSQYITAFNATIGKEETALFEQNYTLEEFYRAKIIAEIPNQEIHFWVYNKNSVMEYSDTVASIICLNKIGIEENTNFTIRARGSYSPNMKVRLDGEEIYSAVINNSTYQDYEINHTIGNNILDIIFDNDFYNATANIDRNLYIENIKIGEKIIYPKEGILDSGTGPSAFDCENTKKTESGVNSNAALRFRLTTEKDYLIKIPQLTYHMIGEDSTSAENIRLNDFKSQMAYLNSSEFNSITFNDYYSWRAGNFTMPDKPIIITFDDGSRSVYTRAKPILDKYSYAGVAGIIASQVGKEKKLTWEEISLLKINGWEIASHSYSHKHFLNSTTEERIFEYNESNKILEKNLQSEINTFIYPYNDQNPGNRTECLLFYTGCTGQSSYNLNAFYMTKYDDLSKLGLRRIKISYNTTMNEYKKILP